MTKPRFKFRSLKSSNDVYRKVVGNIPQFTAQMLEKISAERKLPVGRLVAYAIDKEFDESFPFEYDLEMPKNSYIPGAYAEEAARIRTILMKFPRGVGLDVLCLFRQSVEIGSKSKFMEGYRELFMRGELQFQTLKRPPPHFQFADDYELIMLKAEPMRAPKKAMKKIEALSDANREMERENRELKRKLAEMESKK